MGKRLEDFRQRVARPVQTLLPSAAGLSPAEIAGAIDLAAHTLAIASTDDLPRFHKVGKEGATSAPLKLSDILLSAANAIDCLPRDGQEALTAETANRAATRQHTGGVSVLDAMPAEPLVLAAYIRELARSAEAAPGILPDEVFGRQPGHFVYTATDVAISLFERISGRRAAVTRDTKSSETSGIYDSFARAVYRELGIEKASIRSQLTAARKREEARLQLQSTR